MGVGTLKTHSDEASAWSAILGMQPIGMNEGDGIAENDLHHCVANRQPKTRASRDGSFALETGIELEIVDMSIEVLGSPGDSGYGSRELHG